MPGYRSTNGRRQSAPLEDQGAPADAQNLLAAIGVVGMRVAAVGYAVAVAIPTPAA